MTQLVWFWETEVLNSVCACVCARARACVCVCVCVRAGPMLLVRDTNIAELASKMEPTKTWVVEPILTSVHVIIVWEGGSRGA